MITNEAERNDRALVERLDFEDLGIKTTLCEICKKSNYIYERVINAAGCPYSIVVCKRCGAEPISMPTEKEKSLIDCAKRRYGRNEP